VIGWLEAMLVHGPGDVQGDPYRLDDELKHVILHLYEIDAHGRRRRAPRFPLDGRRAARKPSSPAP
jgi:hypothetical protein